MILFTHVIDTDLHLKTICCLPIRTHHHTSIVDEDVEFWLSCIKEHQEVNATAAFESLHVCSFLQEQAGLPLLMASANSLIDLLSDKSSFMQRTFSLPELSLISFTAASAFSMSLHAIMIFAPRQENKQQGIITAKAMPI